VRELLAELKSLRTSSQKFTTGYGKNSLDM